MDSIRERVMTDAHSSSGARVGVREKNLGVSASVHSTTLSFMLVRRPPEAISGLCIAHIESTKATK